MRSWSIFMAAAIISLGAATPALCRALFTIDVTVDDVTDSRDFDAFDDVIEAFDNDGFRRVNDLYTETSPAIAKVNYRGLPMEAEYPDQSTLLVFRVPSLGVVETFEGATRDESEELLEEFLENNVDGLFSDILRELVATTPIDPVAGNPNSLQARMVASDFAVATGIGDQPDFTAVVDDEAAAEEQDAPNLARFGARFGRFSADGFNQNVINLPLGYAIPLADPRWAVLLDLPITYVETEGANTYATSFGAGLRVPILDHWRVTPLARVGTTGSAELGSLAVLAGGSVGSLVDLPIGPVTVSIGNSVSQIETLPVDAGDYQFEYNLSNTVTSNGAKVEGGLPYEVFGQATTWEATAVNYWFFGDNLHIENYSEFAVSAGTRASEEGVTWDSFRLGLTYTVGEQGYSGFRVNFGYQF